MSFFTKAPAKFIDKLPAISDCGLKRQENGTGNAHSKPFHAAVRFQFEMPGAGAPHKNTSSKRKS